MLVDYSDITSRLGHPLWWDRHGVPRYEPFRVGMQSVYADVDGLMEIACQACDQRFLVGFTWSQGRAFLDWARLRALSKDVPQPEFSADGLHYGDPPPHGCSGDTMNCIDLRIVEWWKRNGTREWERQEPVMFEGE